MDRELRCGSRGNAYRYVTAIAVALALALPSTAQIVEGTVIVENPPVGSNVDELTSQHLFQLRKMGYSDRSVEANREVARNAAEREVAGLRASGDFVMAKDGAATFLQTVCTTTTPGQTRSVVSERYDGESTVIVTDGNARVYLGDKREIAASPIYEAAVFGQIPAQFSSVGSSGGSQTFDRVGDEFWERLIVTYHHASQIATVRYGIVAPEASRNAGTREFTVLAEATRDEAGREIVLIFFTGDGVAQTHTIRLAGEPSATAAEKWPMPPVGTFVVDHRASEDRAENYVFAGELPPLHKATAGIAGFSIPGPYGWIGEGLLVLGIGVFGARATHRC
ncbi:MAG: hypothetical protein AB7F50_07530 [Fimbriimonadaceae bacterium]